MSINRSEQNANLSYTPDFKPGNSSGLFTFIKITASLISIVVIAGGITLAILGIRGDLNFQPYNYDQLLTTRIMKPATLPVQTQCGVQTVKPSINGETLNSQRIINGDTAITDSWPWTVSIRNLKKSQIGSHFCGGSLVYSQYVITAAHCVSKRNKANMVVIIGVTQFNSPLSYSKVFFVQDMIVKADFNLAEITNDIAVLKLNRPASGVENLCLPDANFTRIFGQKVVVTGWGSTTGFNSNKDLSNNLLQVVLSVDNEKFFCSTTTSNYCAMSVTGDSNACYGDSGSPLMHYSKGKWYLYGLTSYVIASADKCLPNLPSYYTAIPFYLEWIASAIATMS
ncbi:unnamed protein product [Brachionus calyciflorus]|uniref:Peptidase S1 domain-containing protein n=1 Tax=Brachionus calyciflorus TaxID=104777 RepID=A0A813NPU4_9BILA|nr:unnamed protein product [Brachionus calyciflorus]